MLNRLCVVCSLLDFLWHLLTDICPRRSMQPLSINTRIYVHNITALIIVYTRYHTVNRDILLTSFFKTKQSGPLNKNVDSAESGLANKHLIVQITRVPQRITETEMNKLTSYR